MDQEKMFSVSDVLKINIQMLENLRVPVKEQEIYQTVSAVLRNCRVCCEAQEKAEAEGKANESDAE